MSEPSSAPPPAESPNARPATAAAWVAEARRLQQQERNASALIAYEQALALDAAFAPAWLGKALLLEDLERPEDALAAYDRLLEHAGNAALQSAAWSNRAGLLLRAQQFPEALASLDAALAVDPENHLLVFNKGLLLMQAFERWADALPWLERAEAAGFPEAADAAAFCRQQLLNPAGED